MGPILLVGRQTDAYTDCRTRDGLNEDPLKDCVPMPFVSRRMGPITLVGRRMDAYADHMTRDGFTKEL